MRIKRIKWLTGFVEKLIDKHAVERRTIATPEIAARHDVFRKQQFNTKTLASRFGACAYASFFRRRMASRTVEKME